jgi:hypothetical protein
MTGSALALSLGWDVEKRSLYDEEGIEGWVWIAPDGNEFVEMGSWSEAPPWPDEAQVHLDKQNVKVDAPSGAIAERR